MRMLIQSTVSDMDVTMNDGEVMEPAFFLPENALCFNFSKYPVHLVADYLIHNISRSPNELRNHIQRIYLFIQLQNSQALTGALVDLYLVLKDKGTALRYRVLMTARKLLSQQDFDIFYHALESGLDNYGVLPVSKQSLFTRTIGKPFLELITKTESGENINLAEVARSYLEYGQIDEARIILEKAVISHPEHDDLLQDLLEIYQQTRDKQHFLAMFEKLNSSDIELPTIWHELARTYFDEAANE